MSRDWIQETAWREWNLLLDALKSKNRYSGDNRKGDSGHATEVET